MEENHNIIKIVWQLIQFGNLEELQKIFNSNQKDLNSNSYITDPNIDPNYLVHIAAASNSKKCLEYLVSQGANINIRNFNGYSALHFAAYSGSSDIIVYLLSLVEEIKDGESKPQKKVFVDCKTIDGKTPLYIASSRGHQLAVERLIRAGADVNSCDSEGTTPLIAAIIGNHKFIVELLISEGADVFHMTAEKLTPSLAAIEYKRSWFKTE